MGSSARNGEADGLADGNLAKACVVDGNRIHPDIAGTVVRGDPALAGPWLVAPDGAEFREFQVYSRSWFFKLERGCGASPAFSPSSTPRKRR